MWWRCLGNGWHCRGWRVFYMNPSTGRIQAKCGYCGEWIFEGRAIKNVLVGC